MKLTIDTTAKTIELKEEIIIDELLRELEKMNIDYTEYKLNITPKEYISFPSPTTPERNPWTDPFTFPWVTYSTDANGNIKASSSNSVNTY